MVDMQRFRDDLWARFGIAQVVSTEAEVIAFMARYRPDGSPLLPASIPGFVEWPPDEFEQDTFHAIRQGLLTFVRRYQCVPTLFNLVLTQHLYWWNAENTQLIPHNVPELRGSTALALTDSRTDRGPNIFLLLDNIYNCVQASFPILTVDENQQRRADVQFHRYRNDERLGLDAPRGALGYRALVSRALVHELHHPFYPSAITDPMHAAFRRHTGWIGPHYTAQSAEEQVGVARKYDVGQPAVRSFIDAASDADLEVLPPASLDPHRFLRGHRIWESPMDDPGQPWSSARNEQPISSYCLDAPDEDFCEIGTAYCSDPGRLILRAPQAYAFAREWLRPSLMREHSLAFPVATGWVRSAVAP